MLLLVGALGGCGLYDSGGLNPNPSGVNAGSLITDPNHYEAYHCNDLIKTWATLQTKEKDLRALMARADEGAGGAFIGAMTYRTDYEYVLGQEQVVRRTAADKKCTLEPTYTSDQSIR
jgi:hypothetical protein